MIWIPLTLVLWALAVGWVVVARSAPTVGILLVSLTTCGAVGLFIGRVVASHRTRYVLTERRVVVLVGFPGLGTKAILLASLPPPVIVERPDRSGSLAFGAFPGAASPLIQLLNLPVTPRTTPVLRDIPDVRRVRDLVSSARAASDVYRPGSKLQEWDAALLSFGARGPVSSRIERWWNRLVTGD